MAVIVGVLYKRCKDEKGYKSRNPKTNSLSLSYIIISITLNGMTLMSTHTSESLDGNQFISVRSLCFPIYDCYFLN